MTTAAMDVIQNSSQRSAVTNVAVVFGASGGIGSALANRLLTGKLFDRVVGFSRTSEPAIDLLTEARLKDAADFAATHGDIRLVVDATGFLHNETQRPERSWRELDPAQMAHSFALNAIGPGLIMKHVLPLFPHKGRSVFATLSARVGSIGDNHLGGWYSYRASKAALNQLVRTAAIELRHRRPEAICVALHPGTVDTRLSSPFGKSDLDVQLPDIAAAHLIAVMDRLGTADSGRFIDHHGNSIPW